MDYCLELTGASRGVKRYRSKEGWEIGAATRPEQLSTGSRQSSAPRTRNRRSRPPCDNRAGGPALLPEGPGAARSCRGLPRCSRWSESHRSDSSASSRVRRSFVFPRMDAASRGRWSPRHPRTSGTFTGGRRNRSLVGVNDQELGPSRVRLRRVAERDNGSDALLDARRSLHERAGCQRTPRPLAAHAAHAVRRRRAGPRNAARSRGAPASHAARRGAQAAPDPALSA